MNRDPKNKIDIQESEINYLSNFAKIIRYLMQKNGITSVAELARKTDLQQPTIQRLLAGRITDPKLSTLKHLADFFEVSLDQLLGNESFKFDGVSRLVTIPIISWEDVSKGHEFRNKLDIHNHEQWITISEPTQKCYGLNSKSSMEPRFPRRSIIIISPNIIPKDGDFVVIQLENAISLKEVIEDGSKKMFRSILQSIPPVSHPDVKIFGVVIQTIYAYNRDTN